jgi:lipopolysaccharide export system permease protein
MTAAGARPWSFARPLLILAAGVAIWVLGANFWLTPLSQRTLADAFNHVKGDLIGQILQPGRFASPESGLTFHIRDRSSDGHLLGLVVGDTRNNDEQFTYLAETGEVVKQGDKTYLVLHQDQIVRDASVHRPVRAALRKLSARFKYLSQESEEGRLAPLAKLRRTGRFDQS